MNEIYPKYLQDIHISRCEAIGRYIADTNDTVRGAAKVFGVSKSTVHKYITINLKQENYALFCRVAQVLQTNKEERHIRGGIATREKYLSLKNLPDSVE